MSAKEYQDWHAVANEGCCCRGQAQPYTPTVEEPVGGFMFPPEQALGRPLPSPSYQELKIARELWREIMMIRVASGSAPSAAVEYADRVYDAYLKLK